MEATLAYYGPVITSLGPVLGMLMGLLLAGRLVMGAVMLIQRGL